MGFLIDTCIWVDVERGEVSPAAVSKLTGNEPVYLSPVTIAELRIGAELAPSPAARELRFRALERLLSKPILPIDAATAQVFGQLAAALRAAGTSHRRRVNDLWIASQAVQHELALLTRNERDFRDIPGLRVTPFPPPSG